MASRGPGEEGPAPGPGSCGHSLQVALQLTHGSLVQGEEIEVEGGVGDVEVTGLLNQVYNLKMVAGQVASESRRLVWGGPHPALPQPCPRSGSETKEKGVEEREEGGGKGGGGDREASLGMLGGPAAHPSRPPPATASEITEAPGCPYLLQHVALPQGHQPPVQFYQLICVGLGVAGRAQAKGPGPTPPAIPPVSAQGVGRKKASCTPARGWEQGTRSEEPVPSSSGGPALSPPTARPAQVLHLVVGAPLKDLLGLAAGLGAPPA